MTESKKENDDPPTTSKQGGTITKPSIPPVEAAGRRLERLFGGGRTAASTSAPVTDMATVRNSLHELNINPPKILKKWLGSSSGTASNAELSDVSHAAFVLLDPKGKCATGREILVMLVSAEKRLAFGSAATTTAAGDNGGMEIDTAPAATMESSYLRLAHREVESWLFSLAIRILWRAHRFEEAYALSEKGLAILDSHLAECDNIGIGSVNAVGDGNTSGGLHPLLARLLRYRSLTIESLPMSQRSAIAAAKRSDLAHRHRMACLRRDSDVSCTVLNLMLRDLMHADQGECHN